jgi:hypothetical protein
MVAKSLATGIVLALAAALIAAVFHPHTTDTEPVSGSSGQAQDAAAISHPSTHGLSAKTAVVDQTDDYARSPADAITADTDGSTRRFEIYGRVTDDNHQTIEGVLVADEVNFGSTRSNPDGSYQISIEQPEFKTPVLIFLRNGYRENRVGIAIHNTPAQASYEINVTLQAATNSTNVHGWVGNELGEGLGGRKISIRALTGQEAGIKFYTVISASNGEFSFEGVRSDITYKLIIEASEHYAGYTLEPFRVSQQTPRTTIILDRLSLVDIEGLIVGVDNAPVASFGINVQNLSLDFPDRRITSDSSGFFALRGFPAGALKLSTNTPEHFKIIGLSLRANDYRNLMLVIDKGSNLLSGWISDENGVPLGKARVTLNAEFSKHGYQSYSHRSTVTDSSGRYQFSQLGDIDHKLFVYAGGYATYIANYRFSSFSDRLDIRLSK